MSGQGLESTCQVENKSLTGSFYLYVYARGVCKSGFNPLNLVYILMLLSVRWSERVYNFWGSKLGGFLSRTPLIKGLLCFTQLCLV